MDGYVLTNASVHDSQLHEELLSEQDKGQEFYADSAYIGENQGQVFTKKGSCVALSKS